MNKFSPNFLFGAATAAYQVEGAYLEDGKSLSIVDRNINDDYADTSVATDHYHRFKEDVALMHELGLKSYRFSISWPRIFPDASGVPNQKGVAFYQNLLEELEKYKIEPIITIYHFDLPIYLQDLFGGWSGREIIPHWTKYVTFLFNTFTKVKYWLTINEQSNMFALPYLIELSGKMQNIEKEKFEMNHVMNLCHAIAVNLCHDILPTAKIGPALGIVPYYPEKCDPKDILATKLANDYRTLFFTDIYVKGTYKKSIWNYLKEQNIQPTIMDGDIELLKSAKIDFLGINYYVSSVVKHPGELESKVRKMNFDGEADSTDFETIAGLYQVVSNKYTEKTKWDWDIDPIGLRILLNNLHDLYDIPFLITENGIGEVECLVDEFVDDEYRIRYLESHLESIKDAIKDGVNVIGYTPWSLIDLLSTSSGFRKRYGFIFVDRTDTDLLSMKRFKKKSFYWYQEYIRAHYYE